MSLTVRESSRNSQGNMILYLVHHLDSWKVWYVQAKNKKDNLRSPTGYKGNDTNMDNYVCHSFQGPRYLSGIWYGMMTKTNKIGVVGSHPIPEIIRNINGDSWGQSVNPDVEVSIIWINSWFDPPKDMDAGKVLSNKRTMFFLLLRTLLV